MINNIDRAAKLEAEYLRASEGHMSHIAFLFPAPPEGRGQAGHAEKEK